MMTGSFLMKSAGYQPSVSCATPFVGTEFIDKIDQGTLKKYYTLRSQPFNAGLTFWGDVIVRVNRASDLFLRDFLHIVISSEKGEVKSTYNISFLGPSTGMPLLDTANRVNMLTAAHTSLTEACVQYRQCRWFRYCGQQQQDHLEAQWHQALGEIQRAIDSIQKPPPLLVHLNEQERIARKVYEVLDSIKGRYSNREFSLHDQEQLQKCRAFAQQIRSEVKQNSTWLSYQIGAQNASSLDSECHYLCQAVEEVENIYEKEQAANEFRAIFEIDPYTQFAMREEVVDNFSARLEDCINDNGFIDISSFNPVMDELAGHIWQQRSYYDGLYNLLQRYKTKSLGPYMHDYLRDLNTKLAALNKWVASLERLFTRTEERRLFFLAGVPCKSDFWFGPSIVTNRSDPNCLNLFYTTKRYLHRSRNEPECIQKLKKHAVSQVLLKARMSNAGAYQIWASTEEHVANRLSAIASFNSLPTDIIITQGENSLPVHKLVLLRFQHDIPIFFNKALSGTWKESRQKNLEISETFLWPAVVEFVSWLYGISAVDEVPLFLIDRFVQAADFCMAGVPLINKLKTPEQLSHL